ncbi:site-2 protease family protein, partial [Corallococcus sp. CA047B]|uniref:site-2 protease family protein n=1 Tax=Corallococcus sp. CA047B TaxID=2316729 RepID=UPI001F43D0BD
GGPGALMRQESSDVASSTASGLDALVRAMVAASVALALLTMVPVPGLDGGRVLLLAIEAVSGRRIPPRVETVAQTAGFLFLSIGIVATAGAEIRRALPASPAPRTVTGGTAATGGAATAHAPTSPASTGSTMPTLDGGTVHGAAPTGVSANAAPPPGTKVGVTPAGVAVAPPPGASAPQAPASLAGTVPPIPGASAAVPSTGTPAPASGNNPVSAQAATPPPSGNKPVPVPASTSAPSPATPPASATAAPGLARDAGAPSPARDSQRVVTPAPP